eukprot:jgi/Botrbrau1/4400/Bobra.105_2s0043.1
MQLVKAWLPLRALVVCACIVLFAQGGLGFVQVVGTSFVDETCQEYIVAGYNTWQILEDAAGFNGGSPDNVVRQFSAAQANNLNVVRMFGFGTAPRFALQSAPGQYNEQVFRAFDYVLDQAAKHGLRVIVALANNWDAADHRSEGIPPEQANVDNKWAYVNWVPSAEGVEDNFYVNSEVKAIFKDHMKTLVNRVNTINGKVYKDDPTVLAWNLLNEPRCERVGCEKEMQSWIEEMSAYLKSLDPNHLISTGQDGFYAATSCRNLRYNPSGWASYVGNDFMPNHAVPSIDYASFHLWPDNWRRYGLEFGHQWVDSHEAGAKLLGKPVILEEFGKAVGGEAAASETEVQRRQWYQQTFQQVLDSINTGGSMKGIMFWRWNAINSKNLGDFDRGASIDSNSQVFTEIIRPFAIYVANLPRKAVAGCVPQGAVPRATTPLDPSQTIRPQGNALRGADISQVRSPSPNNGLGTVSTSSAVTGGRRRLSAVLPGQARTPESLAPASSLESLPPATSPVSSAEDPWLLLPETEGVALPQTLAVLPPTPAALPPTTAVLPPTGTVLPLDETLLPPTPAVLPPAAELLPPTPGVLPPVSDSLPPSLSVLPPTTDGLPPVSGGFSRAGDLFTAVQAPVEPPLSAGAPAPVAGFGLAPAGSALPPAGIVAVQGSVSLPPRLGPEYFLTPDPETCCGNDCGTLYGALAGTIVSTTSTTSPAECCDKCKGTAGCNTWNYCYCDLGCASGNTNVTKGTCQLKTQGNAFYPRVRVSGIAAAGWIGGVPGQQQVIPTWKCQPAGPQCPPDQVDSCPAAALQASLRCPDDSCAIQQTNTGGDVILFDVNSWNPVPRVLSAQDCCAACRDTPNCNVWTYCPRREGCSNDCPEYIGRQVGRYKVWGPYGQCDGIHFPQHTCMLKNNTGKLIVYESGQWQPWVSGVFPGGNTTAPTGSKTRW